MPEVNRHHVKAWWENTATGECHYTKALDGKVLKSNWDKLRVIHAQLAKEPNPVLESVGRRDGYYRPVEETPQPLDFTQTQGGTDFPIVLPFNLRKYVFIYPDNSIVVAGAKSAGKTGFLMRAAEMNREKMNTIILSNLEGGKEQTYDRFLAMGIDLAKVPRFIYHVEDNYHNHIKEPNTLYIIDYIDAPEGTDFYLIGAQIKKVTSKLQGLNSVALIGLQKPHNRDTAFGGDQTLKAPTLYLTMDNARLKILDAKVPSPELKEKHIHPKNMAWTFQYDNEGTNFLNITQDYGGD